MISPTKESTYYLLSPFNISILRDCLKGTLAMMWFKGQVSSNKLENMDVRGFVSGEVSGVSRISCRRVLNSLRAKRV